MDLTTGKLLIENSAKAFKAESGKVFGQIALRVNDDFYLMTKENIILSNINKDTDIDICDINSGDLGVLFHARPDVNAFVFACTESSVEISKRVSTLKSSLDDFSELVGSKIQVLEHFTIRNCINATRNVGGCLVKGLGIVSVGHDVKEAIAAVQIIEKDCFAECKASLLGGIKYIPDADAVLSRNQYVDSYKSMNDESHVTFIGFDENEFQTRNNLIEFGKLLCKESLVNGTWGNISVMINDDEMLITPSGMDYFSIKPEDIVKINIHTLKYAGNDNQRKPSRNLELHARMYRELPDCRSIVHTHSLNLSCFAASHAGFAIGTPELEELIGNVLVTEYALVHSDEFNDNAIDVLKKTHAAILANHGAIFYAPTTEMALTIAGAVEGRAAAILR